MVTGLRAASLPATCDSAPSAFMPPLGWRHGTRLKMSVAVLATSFTRSIVFDATPRAASSAGCAIACDPSARAATGGSTGTTAIREAAITKRARYPSKVMLTLNPQIRGLDMRGLDQESRQCPAQAVMHALGQLHAWRRAKQVKLATFVPLPHDGEPIEQRDVVLLRHHTH